MEKIRWEDLALVLKTLQNNIKRVTARHLFEITDAGFFLQMDPEKIADSRSCGFYFTGWYIYCIVPAIVLTTVR